jgi:hypothetical protein
VLLERNLHFWAPRVSRTSLSQVFRLGKGRQRRVSVSMSNCAGQVPVAGASPPLPPPAKPGVSPLSETGERNVEQSLLRFIERGDDAWWECGFREGSEERVTGVGSARHPAARASVCGVPRASPKMESERFLVMRKERPQEARASPRSASCAQFVARPGSVSGSVVGSSGPGGCTSSAGGFWTARVLKKGKVYPARPSGSETRHCTPRRYMYASGMSGASALSSSCRQCRADRC